MYYSIITTETGTELERVSYYDEAIFIIKQYEKEDREDGSYEKDFYDVKQVLLDSEIIGLKCLIRNEFYKRYKDLKVCDIHIIGSYEPSEYYANILVVDKYHTPMYYKFEIIINDNIELIGMELYNIIKLY